jgi:hypothetical protein
MRDNSKTLSKFLKDILSELRRAHKKSCKNSPSSDPSVLGVDHLLDELQKDIKSISCEKCKKVNKAAGVCNGGTLDDELLAKAPLCWTFITQLFVSLVRLAEKLYSPYLSRSGGHTELRILLRTQVTRQPQILAKTEFTEEDGAECRAATITLDLPIWAFDSVHLHQMAYILFHEIFVHSAESWTTMGHRNSTNERCVFREGFVDAAAAYTLNLGIADGALAHTVHAEFAEEIGLGTEAAHNERVSRPPGSDRIDDPEEKKKLQLKQLRADGKRVFKRFLDRDRAADGVGLAVCLNVISLSDDERIRLLQVLDRSTNPILPKRGRRIEWMEQLLEAVAEHDVAQVATIIADVVAGDEF